MAEELGSDDAVHHFWEWYARVKSQHDEGDLETFLADLRKFEESRRP